MVTQKEMKKLAKDAGHEGMPTPYNIPAFPPTATHGPGKKSGTKTSPGTTARGKSEKKKYNIGGGDWSTFNPVEWAKERIGGYDPGQHQQPGETAAQYHQRMTGNSGEGGGGGGNRPPPGVSQAQYDQLKSEYDEYKGGEKGRAEAAGKKDYGGLSYK